jgi:hypothetical protein
MCLLACALATGSHLCACFGEQYELDKLFYKVNPIITTLLLTFGHGLNNVKEFNLNKTN